MAIAQGILDAQARLATAIAQVDSKVTTLLANQADPTAATAAEQAVLAQQLNDAAAAVEAVVAKT